MHVGSLTAVVHTLISCIHNLSYTQQHTGHAVVVHIKAPAGNLLLIDPAATKDPHLAQLRQLQQLLVAKSTLQLASH
jgi:hypothetical protein